MPHGNEQDQEVGRRRSKRALFRAEVAFGHKGRRCPVKILDNSLHTSRIRAIHKIVTAAKFSLTLPQLSTPSAT